jgi:hypothetical protein
MVGMRKKSEVGKKEKKIKTNDILQSFFHCDFVSSPTLLPFV